METLEQDEATNVLKAKDCENHKSEEIRIGENEILIERLEANLGRQQHVACGKRLN